MNERKDKKKDCYRDGRNTLYCQFINPNNPVIRQKYKFKTVFWINPQV